MGDDFQDALAKDALNISSTVVTSANGGGSGEQQVSGQQGGGEDQAPVNSMRSGVIFSPLVKKAFQKVREDLGLSPMHGEAVEHANVEGTNFSVILDGAAEGEALATVFSQR